jgi:hypothetical protein
MCYINIVNYNNNNNFLADGNILLKKKKRKSAAPKKSFISESHNSIKPAVSPSPVVRLA